MADWSNLPPELIDIVAKRVKAIEDFLTFSLVCRSWRSSADPKIWTPGRQLPWLMLPETKNHFEIHNATDRDDIEEIDEEDKDGKRSFYNPYDKKLYRLDLPEARGRRCWGSPHGWICTIGPDLQAHLINPLTRSQIRLPPLTAFGRRRDGTYPFDQFKSQTAAFGHREAGTNPFDEFISRMVAFQNRSDDSFLVFSIYGMNCCLAVARPGDERWTLIDSRGGGPFEDVVRCSNGQILAAGEYGCLYLCCYLDCDFPEAIYFADTPIDGDYSFNVYRFYLVAPPPNGNSNADLWLVIQHSPVGFQVWEVDFGTMVWRNLLDSDGGSLRGCALFVGDNQSMLLSADEVGCEPDSIYYTDDYFDGKHSLGVFNFKSGTFHPICTTDDGDDHMELFNFHPATHCSIWITPNLN